MVMRTGNKFVVLERVIPEEAIDRALRLLNLEVVNWGLTKEQFDEWHQTKSWFPTLRHFEQITSLADYIPDEYKIGTMAEPQILLHYPDEAEEWDIKPHQDEEPPWAVNQHYSKIIGVALTENTPEMGGLSIWDSDEPTEGEELPVNLQPGDVVVFEPDAWHKSGLNRTGKIRYMIYFRYLVDDDDV